MAFVRSSFVTGKLGSALLRRAGKRGVPVLPYGAVCQRSVSSTSVLCQQKNVKTTQEQQVEEQKNRNKDVGELTELVRDFLDPAQFYNALNGIGIDYFCGVPDSLLK
ncbi:uncharacterized protein LOC117319999, partial [Pecten maximus]|uniref:uncharacterized protein LOC117319999 n=1 Tax=Pecten maximus TaxID=6579 RepID=UPI0014590EEB